MSGGAIGVVGASTRDESFWRVAYHDHGPAVLAYLLRRVGRREEAEDLLQETFVRAMDAGTFREGNLRGYLLRIAHNLNVNRLRRPRAVVTDDEMVASAPDRGGGVVGSPEDAAARRVFRDRLHEVLRELTAPQRQAFEMGVLQQRSYEEISRLTGWKASTVKVKVWRARRSVIDRLGPQLRGTKGVVS